MVSFRSFSFITLFIIVSHSHVSLQDNVNRVKYLRENNFTQFLTPYKLAIVMFYTDWCHFCHSLKPVLEETAAIVDIQYRHGNQVVVAQLNCDEEPGIRDFFHITKYPTLKIIRNGLATRSEYRSHRSTEAFLNFIAEELRDPVLELNGTTAHDVQDKAFILGRFHSRHSLDYDLFSRVCSSFNHFGVCQCFAMFGHAGPTSVTLQTEEIVEPFSGSYNRTLLVEWFTENCIPLVREITFENAEEISEEGRPLLILCHRHEDKTSVAIFKRLIQHVVQYAQNISFVTADNLKYERIFNHYLHLSSEDLPVLRLDDFRHIYRLPSLDTLAQNPAKLVTIVENYFSGQLHVDYHDGRADLCEKGSTRDAKITREVFPIYDVKTESVFRNLTPSKLRYTLISKEEL